MKVIVQPPITTVIPGQVQTTKPAQTGTVQTAQEASMKSRDFATDAGLPAPTPNTTTRPRDFGADAGVPTEPLNKPAARVVKDEAESRAKKPTTKKRSRASKRRR